MDEWALEEPAKKFEREHVVSGIAGYYKFPGEPGLDQLSLQTRLRCYTGFNCSQELTTIRVQEFGKEKGTPSITLTDIQADEELTREFSRFATNRKKEDINFMLSKVEIMNPERTAALCFDRSDVYQAVDVLHGIVSGFSPSDINYYIRQTNSGIPWRERERSATEIERRAIESRILSKLGKTNKKTLGWIPSIETLERIWEQIKDRSPGIGRAECVTKTSQVNP
jgi:hypothetical protein